MFLTGDIGLGVRINYSIDCVEKEVLFQFSTKEFSGMELDSELSYDPGSWLRRIGWISLS